MITKLPPRLEAWDAETSNNGWAINIDELLPWLEGILKEVNNDNTINAKKLIWKLIDHLSEC